MIYFFYNKTYVNTNFFFYKKTWPLSLNQHIKKNHIKKLKYDNTNIPKHQCTEIPTLNKFIKVN